MSTTIFFLLGIVSVFAQDETTQLSLLDPPGLNPDTGLNIYQFLERHQYTYENHTITTEDGYILRTVRIPHGRNETSSGSSKRPAVLMLHGIWSNPQDLILKGPGKAPGFVLADNGYDVWLMASRGNTYSIGHVTLETDSYEFWNFSFHEVGYYDIPANIDYITNVTGNEKVSYVGHSQGGTCYVSMVSARPEYNSKITVAVLYAPVVYLQYCKVFVYPFLRDIANLLEPARETLRLKDLLSYTPIIAELGKIFCNPNVPTVELCVDLIGAIAGPDTDNLAKDFLTVMATNDPAGGSWKQAIHYLQVGQSNQFRSYDYGVLTNREAYGENNPPEYNLSKATSPVVVMYGANDYFVDVKDAMRLILGLPNVVNHLVPYPLQSHVDFVFASNIYEFTSKPTLDYLNNYNGI